MAVIKNAETAGMLKEAIVLDLGDIARQAAQIEAAAQAKASGIEAAARDRAAQLTENAGAEGFEQGKAAGIEAGREEGREQGRLEAFAQAEAELNQLQQTWAQTGEQLEEYRKTIAMEARQSVLELAMRLAEKIVHRTVQVDNTVVVDQVAAAFTYALGDYDVTVRISPDDRPTLEQAMPGLMDQFGRFEHVKLVDDGEIRRGGCVLSFGQGCVDATLDTQLRRIVELLMPEPETDQTPVDQSGNGVADQSTPQNEQVVAAP